MADAMHKHTKAGGSTGDNASQKKSGYAEGPVPKPMQGTKAGLTRGRHAKGYTGPNVQHGKF